MARDSANPSGLLLAGVMMLVHIGQAEAAARVHNAWLATLEEGTHTKDIYREEISKKKVGTAEFAEAVIANMGKLPQTLPVAHYKNIEGKATPDIGPTVSTPHKLIGIDVYVVDSFNDPKALATKLQKAEADGLKLTLLDNRGVKVWPDGHKETFCTDAYRARYLTGEGKDAAATTPTAVLGILSRLTAAGIAFSKTEMLQYFGDERGFTLGQGE